MQVALAWVLKQPGDHLADHRHLQAPPPGRRAVAALSITLTDDEVKALEAPYQPKPVLDHT